MKYRGSPSTRQRRETFLIEFVGAIPFRGIVTLAEYGAFNLLHACDSVQISERE